MKIGSFSARTIGLTAEIIPNYYSHTGLDTLFLTHGIDEVEDAGMRSKQKRVLDVWREFADHPSSEATFADLVADLLVRSTHDGQPRDEHVGALLTSLARDGWKYVVQDHVLIRSDEEPSSALPTVAVSQSESIIAMPPGRPLASGNRIFIVHGHDHRVKEAVARFVEQLGFDAIILHEQANEGRTVLEKFLQEAADAAFAIVILSPDDEARSAETGGDLQSRARQNVVLEFGYFVGLLGRKQVVALILDEVEMPSDLLGLAYVPVAREGDAWKMPVAREMRAAGLVVDFNRI